MDVWEVTYIDANGNEQHSTCAVEWSMDIYDIYGFENVTGWRYVGPFEEQDPTLFLLP